MRILAKLAVAATLLAAVGLANAGDGQGPLKREDVRIDDLRLGQYWYGAPITENDLVGKVVLVELWGS